MTEDIFDFMAEHINQERKVSMEKYTECKAKKQRDKKLERQRIGEAKYRRGKN